MWIRWRRMVQLCWIPGVIWCGARMQTAVYLKQKDSNRKPHPKPPIPNTQTKKLWKPDDWWWELYEIGPGVSVTGFSQCASDILLCFVISHVYSNCISGMSKLFWGVSVELCWEAGNRYTWTNTSLLVCGSFFLIAWFLFCFFLISGGGLWGESLKSFYLSLFGSHESTPGKHNIWFFWMKLDKIMCSKKQPNMFEMWILRQ